MKGNSSKLILLWCGVIFFIIIAGLLSLRVISFLSKGEIPPFLSEHILNKTKSINKSSKALHLGGSGANLPLIKIIANYFHQKYPEINIIVHQSIGSSGGINAVKEGLLDVGLVSRELNSNEKNYPLKVYPYAKTILAIVTNTKVKLENITTGQLLKLIAGVPVPEFNIPLTYILRETGDSGYVTLQKLIPEVGIALAKAYQNKKRVISYSEEEFYKTIVKKSNGIGLGDTGIIMIEKLKLNIVKFNGLYPTQDNARKGDYKLIRTLSAVTKDKVNNKLIDLFIDFLLSKEMAIEGMNYNYIGIGSND